MSKKTPNLRANLLITRTMEKEMVSCLTFQLQRWSTIACRLQSAHSSPYITTTQYSSIETLKIVKQMAKCVNTSSEHVSQSDRCIKCDWNIQLKPADERAMVYCDLNVICHFGPVQCSPICTAAVWQCVCVCCSQHSCNKRTNKQNECICNS